MRSVYVALLSLAAVLHGQDCNRLLHAEGICPVGAVPANLTMLTKCAEYICKIELVNPSGYCHGSDMTKKLAGSNEGCTVQEWNGRDVDDVICVGPYQPPSPTAPPAPAICKRLLHWEEICPVGAATASLDTMTKCREYICDVLMSPTGVVHGANSTKKLVGSANGCKFMDWDGTGIDDVICLAPTM